MYPKKETSRKVTVRQALEYIPGKPLRLTTPKSMRSRRTIDLGEDTTKILRHYLKATRPETKKDAEDLWQEHGLVFPSTVGTPINPRNLVRTFKTILENAKVPNIRFHDLRHVYASLALREGLDLRELSERLGHYDPAFTLSTYTHVLEDAKGSAMTFAELTAGKEDPS